MCVWNIDACFPGAFFFPCSNNSGAVESKTWQNKRQCAQTNTCIQFLYRENTFLAWGWLNTGWSRNTGVAADCLNQMSAKLSYDYTKKQQEMPTDLREPQADEEKNISLWVCGKSCACDMNGFSLLNSLQDGCIWWWTLTLLLPEIFG